MSTITVIQLLVASLIGYFMIYSIVHRICTCVEKVETVKAYGKMVDANGCEPVQTPRRCDTKDA